MRAEHDAQGEVAISIEPAPLRFPPKPVLEGISAGSRFAGPGGLALYIMVNSGVGAGICASVEVNVGLLMLHLYSSGLALLFLYLVNAVDPGEVTWKGDPEPDWEKKGPPQANSTLDPGVREIVMEGEQKVEKWCSTCKTWRPPRAHHCRICNRCYERFDHHCPCMGTCIARGNHRFFILFLLAAGLAAACAALHAAIILATVFASGNIWGTPSFYLLMGYAVLNGGTGFVVGNTGVGVCLFVLCDVTTKERIYGTRRARLPGCGTRPIDVWCAPIRFRKRAERLYAS